MKEHDLKDAQLFELIYAHDEDTWSQGLLTEHFDSEQERNEWLAQQVKLGLLRRIDRMVPFWTLTAGGKSRVEDARASFADRRQRSTAAKSQLLVWVDGDVTQVGTIEGRIGDFFESPVSYFSGQQFSESDIDDAAAHLEQTGLIKRSGAWGAPTIRLGITSAGRDCVTDFGRDLAAWGARNQQQSTTYNIHDSHTIAIAHGHNSTANATSMQETFDRSVTLAQSIRQIADTLNLNADDLAALDDIESREPGRVKRGLQHIATFAQQSTTGAMGSMLAAGALELLQHFVN